MTTAPVLMPRSTRMNLDRRVVDVDDALDASGNRLLQVVLFRFADPILVQVR